MARQPDHESANPFKNMKNDSHASETLPPQTAYDQWAEEYDDADPTTLLDEPFLRSMMKLFDGCRVLDLGCGTGRYMRRAAQPGIQVVGLDLSRAMLARARRSMTPETSVSNTNRHDRYCTTRVV